MNDVVIRVAGLQDAQRVYEIMHEAHAAMDDPAAYITDSLSYVQAHIQTDGFCLVAEVDGVTAGFFLVCIPGLHENNLGYELGFSEEKLMETALMDSAAVLPAFQGKGLMGRMFCEAVAMAERNYLYLLGTVHPDNLPSRRNFEKCGFLPAKRIVKPGGYVRLLMEKCVPCSLPAKSEKVLEDG